MENTSRRNFLKISSLVGTALAGCANRANIQNKQKLLDFLRPKLDKEMFDKITYNSKNLILSIDNFKDIATPNNLRFKEDIDWFLGSRKNYENHTFYVMDNKELNLRKLNVLIKLHYVPTEDNKIETKYEALYIPIPKN